MAVSDYTYGTVTGLEAKVGWVVDGRDFTDTTTPTTTQVEAFLDQVAAEIHAALAEAGYPVETKANVASDAPRAENWLVMLNETGAAAMVIMTFAIAGDPETTEKPAGYWKNIYEAGKKLIRGSFLETMGLARTTDLSALLVCGSVTNEDGEDKKPLFKRGMFDYPGSRSLVEEE